MTQLLQNAAYGTAMILAVALLRRTLKDRLVPAARLALWAVCLFRLLTPAAPESVLSLWGLSRLFDTQKQPAAPAPSPSAAVPVPSLSGAAIPTLQPAPGISWETVLLAVWLIAGAALAARYAVSWRHTRRAVACAVPLDRGDPRYASLPKCARLREGPMEGAPLTFGVVRPTVVLLPGLDGAELDCVLAHEGVHAARRDNLWHYAMAAALVVHWWNPAVWLMSRLLRWDVELSCDRAALKKLGADRRADYANALVSLATQRPGPAFCQTFGRKAAEERILSIMKFKKTSVIGVIFTLALVLAVTVAFASEPKDPKSDTVEFHGQTFSRSELSQETLDWLDWYLSLSEEGQLSVSMVPPELISGENPANYDAQADGAYSSEKIASSSTNMRFEDKVLKQFTISISALEEDLAIQVSTGSISSTLAPRILDLAKSIATDGILDWTFEGDSGLTYEDLGHNRTAVCYRDADGNLIPISLSGIVTYYILPQAFATEDPPVYIEEEIESNGITGELLGEGDIVYDEGRTIDDYNVNLPTFDEDGNPVGIGTIGSRFYTYEIVTGSDAVSGGVVRTSSGTHELCADSSCDVDGMHYHDDHDHSKVTHLYYQDPYEGNAAPTQSAASTSSAGTSYPVCHVSGCALEGHHDHNGVTYCGGADHHSDTCDGTCVYRTQQSAAGGSHHEEGYTAPQPPASGSHHSDSHHSGGHH